MGYSFRVAAKDILYAPSQDSTYTHFVTKVVEYWLEREIVQSIHHEDRLDDPSYHERTPYYGVFTHDQKARMYVHCKDNVLCDYKIWKTNIMETWRPNSGPIV